MQYLNLFLRAFETAMGLFGMLMVLSKLHRSYRSRCIVFVVVSFISSSLLTVVYMLTNKLIIERIWLPVLFVVMFTGLITIATDRWQVKLFNLFTHFNVYMLISYLCQLFAKLMPDQSPLYYLLFRAVLFAGVIYLEYRFIRKPFRHMVDIIKSEWIIVIAIGGIFFILNVLLGIYPMMHSYWHAYNDLLVAVTYSLMVVVYYCFYIILHNVILRYEKEQTNAVVSLKLSYLERQIEMQKQSAENIRRARHDLRHNCLVAIGQISSGDYAGAIDFLKQFTDQVEPYPIGSYCENNAVNCVLSAHAERAKKKGVSVDIKANVPEKLFMIDEVDLASLFANAFENAIEGCIRAEADCPFIHIFADFSDNRMLLSVKNTCGKVEFDDELPVSTKSGGGTGTKSITYITEKYNGMAKFDVSNNVFTMQAYLLDE